MSKVAVVYWSMTGNTEMMAQAVVEGVEATDSNVEIFKASEFDKSMLADYDKIAFGCPSMGAETLEESEFQPMFDSVKNDLANKDVVIFGSYGWGDGEWMRNWQLDLEEHGVELVAEGLMVNETPDADGLNKSRELGQALANA